MACGRSVQRHKEEGWEIFFWTNNKSYIPHTVAFMEGLLGKPTLEIGAHIKNVTRPISEVVDFKPKTVDQLGNKVDFAKYLVLEEFGGLLIDFDWLVNKPLTHNLLSRYDVILPNNGENYFLACASHHPILINLIDAYEADTVCSEGNPPRAFVNFTRAYGKNSASLFWLNTNIEILCDHPDYFGLDLQFGSWRKAIA